MVLALAAGVAMFALSFVIAQRLCVQQLSRSTDNLEWLREEFRLSADELARVRALHEGYLPQCAVLCEQIAAKKRELESTLAGVTNITAAAEQQLAELGVLRAHCQTQMLRHFVEVSQAMPPEQGRRYLAEMQRVTLGFHEQIEQSMPGAAGHDHGHH
jgi:Heavy-metal resistance